MRRWLMTSVLQATLHMVDLEAWDKSRHGRLPVVARLEDRALGGLPAP